MVYTAADFRGPWTNSSQNSPGGENREKRHILDLEIAALLANCANLNVEQALAFKDVLNNEKINKHDYESASQNVWDRKVLLAVFESFRDRGGHELPSQQASHIKMQIDVLNHNNLKVSFNSIGATINSIE